MYGHRYPGLEKRPRRSFVSSISPRTLVAKPRRPLLILSIICCLLSLNLFRVSHHRSLPPRSAQDPNYGRLNTTNSVSRYAIATFLTEDTYQSDEDGYFIATRILTYQLLHDEKTRISPENRARIDWVVMVTAAVSEASRDRLRQDGALVVEVESVHTSWWISTGITRWKDQFTKLRLLQMIQYERVLFIDADTLLNGPVDTIFDEEEEARHPSNIIADRRRNDEVPYPAQYVFMARPDNALMGERDHQVPPPQGDDATNSISAGFWLAAPSQELFAFMLGIMAHWRRFDSTTMEQAMFNYIFRRDGPMPWKEMNWKWSATWPSERDRKAGIRSLHEKLWRTGPDELMELWREWRKRMEDFWDGKAAI